MPGCFGISRILSSDYKGSASPAAHLASVDKEDDLKLTLQYYTNGSMPRQEFTGSKTNEKIILY